MRFIYNPKNHFNHLKYGDSSLVIDSIIVRTMNELKQKDIFTYDSFGNKITHTIEVISNSIWISKMKFSYEYDMDGNNTSFLEEYWKDSNFVSSVRENYI